MTIETEGQQASGEEPRAQETVVNTETTPAPRNDAEAAAQEAAAKEAQAKEEAEKAKREEEAKPPKRNRTGEYINRLQTRVRELESDLAAIKAKAPDSRPAPTLEQSNFDPVAHQRATAEWAASQALDSYKFQQQQETANRRLQEVTETYNGKVAQFVASHPDFADKVMAIPYQPSEAVQLAIMAHENGPEIAYALANDDDLAFQLASIQPHLAAAAVDRIASRLAAAPQALPNTPAPQAPQAAARPVSKAPPPVATVSGKSPTETPPEKLTDQQWWERRNKRAS